MIDLKTVLIERYKSHLTTPHMTVCSHGGLKNILIRIQVSRYQRAALGDAIINSRCRIIATLWDNIYNHDLGNF